MKHLLIRRTGHALLVLATLAAFAGAPLDSEARADDPVKKVKVRDHKVKVKVKGPNGDLAADIAYAAANPSCDTGTGYYK